MLDRDRAWRQNTKRREHAEEERIQAEMRGATAERKCFAAESSTTQAEALARENARLYAQAQYAVQAREDVLAMVSHDLKSPLGAILLTTRLLSENDSAAAKLELLPRAVVRIENAAQSMLRLIDDLLDFASIEAGHLAIKCELQEPGTLVRQTLARFERIVEAKRLRLRAEVAPELPAVSCDRERIVQVLSNLVSNATHVVAEGGEIIVRVERRAAELCFSVADNGPGISEADIGNMFDRYWRSSGAVYKGTGLGLAIAEGIVSAHGSRIWVESTLGSGATFLFTLAVG